LVKIEIGLGTTTKIVMFCIIHLESHSKSFLIDLIHLADFNALNEFLLS